MVTQSTKAREVLYEDEATGRSCLALLFVEDIFTNPDEYDVSTPWGIVARGILYTASGEEDGNVESHLPYGFEKFEDALDCATDPNLDWTEFEIFGE